MIAHLFKLIWNQKRKHLGLQMEVFASFLIIFAVFSFLTYHYRQYTEPLGFDYDNTLVIGVSPGRIAGYDPDNYRSVANINIELIRRQLEQYPEFESFSFSNIAPYTKGYSSTLLREGDRYLRVPYNLTDEQFQEVLTIPVEEGNWFDSKEYDKNLPPTVINRKLQEMWFGGAPALGEILPAAGQSYKVTGVIGNFKKDGEFADPGPTFFVPIDSGYQVDQIIIRLKPGIDVGVKSRLFDDIKRITKGWTVQISYMDELRSDVLIKTWIPMLLALIVGGFLIFNVGLGLFGMLWQNIHKRREEIGVRRAVGATRGSIWRQIVGENLVLATFSLALGLFFALQFPLLDVFKLDAEVYLVAIGISIVFMYLVVIFCSLYPGIRAAKIQPAVALHEE